MMVVGVLIMVLAFLVWITSDYPDFNLFRLFGFLESGLSAMIQTQLNWLRVVAIAAPGLMLFYFGRHLMKKEEAEPC